MSSASVPVESILYNWSDSEWQRSMLSLEKLNRISFIHDHDNDKYLLNSDSDEQKRMNVIFFLNASDLVYAISSKCRYS